MADFLDFKAEESTSSEEELSHQSKKKRKKSKTQRIFKIDSSEEEDDEDELTEIRNDLIDDNSIEEESGSDYSDSPKKRQVLDDDVLDDDEYDLIEENLGVKIPRNKCKRLKIIEDSDEEAAEREANCEEVDMELGTDDEKLRDEDGGEYSETDDFIVKDKTITQERITRKPIFHDAALQEAQAMFGVDFGHGKEEEQNEMHLQITGQKKVFNKSIFEVYEPYDLYRSFFTEKDNKIRRSDIPERIQLREVPITTVPRESNELNEEATWIYQQAFAKPTISSQNVHQKGRQTIPKICKALDFMRNQHLEVPFIAFYRKEYIKPELHINDLWKIHKYDEKWCRLKQRKEKLLSLLQSIRNQRQTPHDVGAIKDSDVEFLKNVQTFEELQDVRKHLFFYHGQELTNWQAKEKEHRKIEKHANNHVNVQEDEKVSFKSANKFDPYNVFKKAGLDDFVTKFGLTPQKFGENLRDRYQRHQVQQETSSVEDIAQRYVGSKFKTVADVLAAAQLMMALQIAKEPMVKKCIRKVFFERATITVKPTKYGASAIDEDHNCYRMKCLKNKPVKDLTGDEFLKLHMAQEEKHLIITINDAIKGNISDSFLDEVKRLYTRNEFSKHVQNWNALRVKCLERAFVKYILPDLKKELEKNLLEEAKECILKSCCKKISKCIRVAPYQGKSFDQDDEWNTSMGVRVMAIAYELDDSVSPFTCIAAPHGDITHCLKLPHLLRPKHSYVAEERYQKQAVLLTLRKFIYTRKPHVIVIGGESREALTIMKDIKEVVFELVKTAGFPPIEVEIINNELAKVYANCDQGRSDFPEYPELLRQAISLARKMQDPLIAYAQLCNSDDDILSLQYHPLQNQIPKEKLLEHLLLEFVNRTNEVGVDINQAIRYPHKANLVQFICGLGPRKAQALLKFLKKTNTKIENRTQIVTACHIGPNIFVNCSGFIKIDINGLGDFIKSYVDPLDGSRIHPETYNWAKKMAVDALEYDVNPNDAVKKILNAPEQLDELDLDAYAIELERNGFGCRSMALYDIRAEFHSPYEDLRFPYVSSNSDELFDMLTKTTSDTFYVGKLITGQVSNIIFSKPNLHQLKIAKPRRSNQNGFWKCPFCKNDNFETFEDVTSHFRFGHCPGKAVVVKLNLDNGICGYIHISKFSDSYVENLQDYVSIGQILYCRILTINKKKFSIQCTTKSSDLFDKLKPEKDPYYYEYDENDNCKREIDNENENNSLHVKSVCTHPDFKNMSFGEAEQYLENLPPGEIIIRPSSKKSDCLVVTWKIANKVYQHINVKQEGTNDESIAPTFRINDQRFEDLDEIIEVYINPMMTFCIDMLFYKYYKDTNGGMKSKMEELLKEAKVKNPLKMHYFVSASKSYPGKFLLSYLPRDKCKHEYVTITTRGYKFRNQLFTTIIRLFNWFKLHCHDRVPGVVNVPVTSRCSVNAVTSHSMSVQKATQNSETIARETLTTITNQMPSYSSMHNSIPSDSSSMSYNPSVPPFAPSNPSYRQTPESLVTIPSYDTFSTLSSTNNSSPHNSRSPSNNQTYPTQSSKTSNNAAQWVGKNKKITVRVSNRYV